MQKVTDEQLAQYYLKKGDERALEILVKRYMPRIYGYARNFTGNSDIAGDITQETFVKMWRSLKRFNPAQSFKTWLFTIAKRTAIDWLRKRDALPLSALEQAECEGVLDSLADGAPSALERLFQKDDFQELAFAMERLPFYYSSVIHRHIGDGMSFRKIAETTGEPLNTVKSRYRRGLALLKKILLPDRNA